MPEHPLEKAGKRVEVRVLGFTQRTHGAGGKKHREHGAHPVDGHRQVLPGGRAVLFTSHTSTSSFYEASLELLVLATGLVPNNRNDKLAKVLKIKLNDLGFFEEKHPLAAPLETDVEGIYLCGGATGPIDISESVVQACAAAMKAIQ